MDRELSISKYKKEGWWFSYDELTMYYKECPLIGIYSPIQVRVGY